MTVPLRWPMSALVSFHYFPNPKHVREFADGGLRLIADSGAFSALSLGAPITVDAFAEWAREVKDHTSWIASLDVIGDPEGTWTNWTRLRDLGVESVPTVHYGAAPAQMDRYAAEGVDFLGLGGMVGRKSEPQRLMRWALAMMRYARTHHPAMRFHGWGVTHPLLIQNLPWYSIDSSGFGTGFRYGRLVLFDPVAGRMLPTVEMNGRASYKLGQLLRTYYDVDPGDVASSSSTNRPLHVRVAARSAQLLEEHLQRRHNVQPPTYAVRDAIVGTAVHIADTGIPNLRNMLDPSRTTPITQGATP